MEAKDRCDITISIDCDGQDDINAMDQMVDVYLDGCDIVYGVRSNRATDTFFKRFTAETFLPKDNDSCQQCAHAVHSLHKMT